jgi:hypothetical protein
VWSECGGTNIRNKLTAPLQHHTQITCLHYRNIVEWQIRFNIYRFINVTNIYDINDFKCDFMVRISMYCSIYIEMQEQKSSSSHQMHGRRLRECPVDRHLLNDFSGCRAHAEPPRNFCLTSKPFPHNNLIINIRRYELRLKNFYVE